MNRYLSVVLPVRNAELTLVDNLQHIFDVLADLTERFEVVLVDEGSTDQTVEVAHELSVQYPQLRVSRFKEGHDDLNGIESELDDANGEVVFLHESQAQFSPRVVRRLWEMCHEEESAAGTSPCHFGHSRDRDFARAHGAAAPRLLGASADRVTEMGGVRLIQRAAEHAD